MSTTYTLDTSTSRANPTPAPMKRLTVPAIRQRKGKEPLVMLTAYTVRMAQIMDPHCDLLLVGDSLGQVIYGLPSTVPVTLEMMAAHGAAVVRGSYHAVVVIDMPFGSYERSPEQAFESASRLMKETGAAAVKLEGGAAMAPTVQFLSERGIPVMGHVGLRPQAVLVDGAFKAKGRTEDERARVLAEARATEAAGAFCVVVEGVAEPLAREITEALAVPTVGIGASAGCDGQILVVDDMLGLFDWTPKFVRRYADLRGEIAAAARAYAEDVRARRFPGPAETYFSKT